MTEYTVIRLALVLAIQAEIEGMKAENVNQHLNYCSPAWTKDDFCKKANELRNLAAKHDHQL